MHSPGQSVTLFLPANTLTKRKIMANLRLTKDPSTFQRKSTDKEKDHG